MPAALRGKPDLPSHLLIYWGAFMDLAHDRQVFMGGVSQIPFTAIDRWASRFGVEGDAFGRLLRLIRAMDGVWLEDVQRRTKAKG